MFSHELQVMSERNEIPWNKKPKNGMVAFFTEATFSKWIQEETYETRLAANLEKYCKGVILPKLPPPVEIKDTNQTAIPTPATECAATSQPDDVFDIKDDKAARKSKSGHAVERDKGSFRKIPREVKSEGPEPKLDVDRNDDISKENPIPDHKISKVGKFVSAKGEGMNVPDEIVKNVENETPENSECFTDQTTGQQKDLEGERKEDSGVKPKLPTSPKLSPSKEAQLNDAEKRKKAIECNFFFYNKQDRKDKYVPMLAKKRPRTHNPSLTPQEQETYLDMKKRFAKLDSSQLNPQQESDYKIFKGLSHKVEEEQQKFMKHLRYVFTQCEQDYRYIHKEVEKYIGEKFLVKKKRVTQFPRFYQPLKRVDLSKGFFHSTPQLEYIQPLLQLGTVPRMVLPQIVAGLPQPCIPTDSQKVNSVCPTVRDVVKGVCVWNHEECSQDINAEQLAVSNKCNFVFTSSAIKHLVEHQAFHGKLWNMPITVRDYSVQEGDKNVTHKVIYVNKPLIKTAQYTVQDRNKLYQKYALKSVAVRSKTKPHVFSNIKPSSEVVKYVTIEDVKKEVEEYDHKVKEDKASNDGAKNYSEPSNWMTTKKNRKRKKKMTFDYQDMEVDKKSVGMFDLENEIDDLETFGMEKSQRMSGKVEKKSEMLSPGKDSEGSSILSSKSCSRDRKLLETDLEMIKKGFEGLNARNVESAETSIVDHEDGALSATCGSKILSKKSLPSLSERLKQMSNIRSKLNMKPLQSDLSASTTSIVENPHDQNDKDNDNSMNKSMNSVKSMETESDSDVSDDGLIIDVPTIPEQNTEHLEISPDRSVLDGGENPKVIEWDTDDCPASWTQETPESMMKSTESEVMDAMYHVTQAKCDVIPHSKDKPDVNIEYSDSKTDAVSKCTSEKPVATATSSADIALEDIGDQPSNLDIDTESSGISTRGSKRRSVEMNLGESTPKRRSLRSSNVAGDSEIPQTGHYTRQSARKNTVTMESPKSNTSPEQTKDLEKSKIVPTDRITRSRSASAEVSGAESTSPCRRVTRQSLETDEILQESEKISQKGRSRSTSKRTPETKKEEIMKETELKTSSPQPGSQGLSPEYYSKKEEDITEAENKPGTSQNEDNIGIDHILNLQAKLWKPSETKGTARGSFAAKHGMNKVVFPLSHNVTYHQWKFGDFNLLIRCSYHGYSNPQGFVHIATKLEYQPYYGFEKQVVTDIAKNWMSAYIRPKCTLVRARINPYNSEVMMMDNVELNDLIPPDCGFRPTKAMADLQCILEGLKDLPAGQYLVNNQPKRDHVTVFKATPEGERGPFDLHYYHATQKVYPEGKEPVRARWVPIDTELLLQHQKRLNLIPCTFTVNEAQGKATQPQEKKSGKKKKKRKPKKKTV